MSDVFTGRHARVVMAPETACISTPMMCVDRAFHVMPGKGQDVAERVALLDEMLDYGQRNAYVYLSRHKDNKTLGPSEVEFRGFRDIVDDWKARVSVVCPEEP